MITAHIEIENLSIKPSSRFIISITFNSFILLFIAFTIIICYI